ncbi:MAG: sugar ABC transporter permease [Lachnospiraceae bacterium]|nr:sugar ABC transporter permease [Lachnospiraceae bacterium]
MAKQQGINLKPTTPAPTPAPAGAKETYLQKYILLRKHNVKVAVRKAKMNKSCYLFLAPFAIIFTLFYIFPVVASIFFSFTYYNILETPRFIGLNNYISLLLEDEIFLIGIKNTLIIALVTGPLGYIMSFLFAWLINELPRWVRSVAIVVFYAPSIAGNCFVIFSVFFRGDAYGYVNAFLMNTGIIDNPILWLTNPQYMLPICMLVILWMSLGAGFLSFVAGLQGVDPALFEAGCIDGIRNRWQELWFITLPSMKPMLMFGAVMTITTSFGVCDVTMALCGYPSTDYAARTIVTHLFDYGFSRFEMGYACAIATILFLMMILCNKAIQSLLRRVGT